MTIQEIITLTNAGWSKDEIMSLTSGEQFQQQEQPAEQPKPDEKPAEQSKLDEKPAEQPKPDRMAQLETKLDYVINRFNLLAVQQSHQPDDQKESLDDILSSVVRGTQKPDKK